MDSFAPFPSSGAFDDPSAYLGGDSSFSAYLSPHQAQALQTPSDTAQRPSNSGSTTTGFSPLAIQTNFDASQDAQKREFIAAMPPPTPALSLSMSGLNVDAGGTGSSPISPVTGQSPFMQQQPAFTGSLDPNSQNSHLHIRDRSLSGSSSTSYAAGSQAGTGSSLSSASSDEAHRPSAFSAFPAPTAPAAANDDMDRRSSDASAASAASEVSPVQVKSEAGMGAPSSGTSTVFDASMLDLGPPSASSSMSHMSAEARPSGMNLDRLDTPTPAATGGQDAGLETVKDGDNTLTEVGGVNPNDKKHSSKFVFKLYKMVSDTECQHLISWNPSGTSVIVCNFDEFSRDVLGKHFKHSNFSSFIRQLNMYGFYKVNKTPRGHRNTVDSQIWEFSHPKFLRGRPDLLDDIRRKALDSEHARVEARDLQYSVAVTQMQLRQQVEEMQFRVDELTEQNAALRTSVVQLRGVLGNLCEFLKGANGGHLPFDAQLLPLNPATSGAPPWQADGPPIFVTDSDAGASQVPGHPGVNQAPRQEGEMFVVDQFGYPAQAGVVRRDSGMHMTTDGFAIVGNAPPQMNGASFVPQGAQMQQAYARHFEVKSESDASGGIMMQQPSVAQQVQSRSGAHQVNGFAPGPLMVNTNVPAAGGPHQLSPQSAQGLHPNMGMGVSVAYAGQPQRVQQQFVAGVNTPLPPSPVLIKPEGQAATFQSLINASDPSSGVGSGSGLVGQNASGVEAGTAGQVGGDEEMNLVPSSTSSVSTPMEKKRKSNSSKKSPSSTSSARGSSANTSPGSSCGTKRKPAS